MGTSADVLVIGGGVIGLSTAYVLAREGARVQVVERTTPGTEASWAGAGIIPPGNFDRARSNYDRLRAWSSQAFPSFTAELRERTGIDNGYRPCGGIEFFEQDAEGTVRLWDQEGIAHQPLSTADVAKLEPAVRSPTLPAYYLPGMAQVRNPRHLRALNIACQSVGVDILPHSEVTGFQSSGSRVSAVCLESGEARPAEQVLIAAGAWSDRLTRMLDVRTRIHPVLGQMVLFRPPRRMIDRIISVEKRYLVPREDGRILAGSTEEPEAGFDKRTTPSGIAHLTEFAISLIPELSRAPVEHSWAGLRPGTADGLPSLGRLPGWENVFLAAGHFRAGIQLSLATARSMADVLACRPPLVPLDDFRPDREPARAMPMAFRS